MSAFWMMVGLSGSGKSYHAELVSQVEGAIIVSTDTIRRELFGSDIIQKDHNKVFAIANSRIFENLKGNANVIFEATNLNRKKRVALLDRLPKNTDKFCILCATSFNKCLENNENRDRKVPVDIIRRQRTGFCVPYFTEGFNDIILLYNKDDIIYDYQIDGVVSEFENYEQDNPHHSDTLGVHLSKVNYKVAEKTTYQNALVASLLHDCGKPATKVFDDNNIAHYYRHENVGAYESLFYSRNLGFTDHDILEIAILVELHMRMYEVDKTGKNNKLLNILGSRLYRELEILHEADKEAH